jgi:hypothetical protein
VLAWFHCPHCPCTLGITWVHPKEMPVVEENVRSASWLPRVADFKEYNRLFEDTPSVSPGCHSPMMMMMMEDCSMDSGSPGAAGQGILGDRTNMLEQQQQKIPLTPVVHRKTPINVQPRKSARKPKPTPTRSTTDGNNNKAASTSPSETPTYKPRRSKYDIR